MQHTYDASNVKQIPGAKVAILQSKWHSEITDVMVNKCEEILKVAGCEVVKHVLPGSLELPLAAQHLAQRDNPPDAIVVFGAVMKGETGHYDLILDMLAQGFTRVIHDSGVPILVEVLPVMNMEQLIARSSDNEHNKGIEAAQAAIDIVAWRRANP